VFAHPDWEKSSFDDRGSGTDDWVEDESRIDGDFYRRMLRTLRTADLYTNVSTIGVFKRPNTPVKKRFPVCDH